MIARKLQTAFIHQLTPILCIGDTLEQSAAGRSQAAEQAQLTDMVRVYKRTGGPFHIAHEPTWAMSTGNEPHECEPEEAEGRHSFIRSVIPSEHGEVVAANTTLLYRGSVTASNADAYFTRADINGGLVGAASITTYGRSRTRAGRLHERSIHQRWPRRSGTVQPRRDSP